MADFPANAIVRHSMFVQLGAQVAQIDRTYCGFSTAFDSGWDAADFFAQVTATGLIPVLKGCVTNSATYLGQKLYWKPASAPPVLAQSVTASGVCTGGAGYLPTQTSGLIQFKSVLGGSQGRGRMYVPFPPLDACTVLGVCEATYLGDLDALAGIFTNGYNVPNTGGAGGTLWVYPCTTYRRPDPVALPVQIDQYFVSLGFATQRRRGYFGKPNSNPF